MKLIWTTGLLAIALASTAAPAADWPDLSRPPMATGWGEQDAALVIGIEDYSLLPHIPGATRNAEDWYAFLTRTLKVPIERATLLLDAEATDKAIRSAVRKAAAQTRPNGTLWLVFIGHGTPAADPNDGWLLAADAQLTTESVNLRGVQQRELLELLSRGHQSRTLVVLDTCFGGGHSLAPPSRSKAVTALMTSGGADEFSAPLPGARRPAFSYLLLGALRGWGDANGDGKVTAEEAVEYARSALQTVTGDRRQTPTLTGDARGATLGRAAAEKGPDLAALSADPAAPAPAAPQVGSLILLARPIEGTRVQLTDPTGRVVEVAVPLQARKAPAGKWKLLARSPDHEEIAQEFEVPADETALVRLELKTLGRLKVTGKQSGGTIVISGPAGFSFEGALPWDSPGLKSGGYRVQVLQPGYKPWEQVVTVVAGTTVTAALPTDRFCPVGMAYVPGGAYKFGGARPVTVAGFCMDLTEVTVEAYVECVSKWGCVATQPGNECNAAKTELRIHPVNCVDWNQSDAFCKLRGKRLPTEEEWEWAARGGPEGWKYPWGNSEPGAKACWDGEGNDLGALSRTSTCVVGRHPEGDNPQGIHDLAGNVWEWTGGQLGFARVFRGGCWTHDTPQTLTASYRGWGDPTYQFFFLGFRCAQSP